MVFPVMHPAFGISIHLHKHIDSQKKDRETQSYYQRA